MAAVTRFDEPNLFRSACISVLYDPAPLVSQLRPHAPGYSQSMSMPSNTSAHRGSSTSARQDWAKVVGSAAAWPNPPDHVQPPKDQMAFRLGCSLFSLRSWLKLPRRPFGS